MRLLPAALKAAWRSARPAFLILAPICVLLGASTSLASAPLDTGLVVLLILGVLLAHISANQLNEYLDFRSGLDLHTRRTPFSGGSGSLPEQPQAATTVLRCALLSLLGCCLIGLYFVWLRGWPILLMGLAGVALILFYTRTINRQPWLCLIAPGLGFGPLVVGGSHYALLGQFSAPVWWAAALVFCLSNNLLLLNQYPDIAADTRAGRRHLLISHGLAAGNRAYLLFALVAALLPVTGVLLQQLPSLALLALLPMPLALLAWQHAVRYGAALGEHPAGLAANVALCLGAPTLLALGLALSR